MNFGVEQVAIGSTQKAQSRSQTLLGEELIFKDTIFENTKTFWFLEGRICLFHSMIVKPKKKFSKMLFLVLKRGMSSPFLVA